MEIRELIFKNAVSDAFKAISWVKYTIWEKQFCGLANFAFVISAVMVRREKSKKIMLAQFTWQQFLVAAMVLSLVWYLGVILVFYRRDVSNFLSKGVKQSQPERLQREWEEELEDEPEEENLMGSVREPEGLSTVAMEELRFAPKTDSSDAERGTQLGVIPDVLEELKGIFSILQKEGGTKEDFISVFALISAKYPAIKGTPSQQALNEHIRENVLFPISDAELDQLWT